MSFVVGLCTPPLPSTDATLPSSPPAMSSWVHSVVTEAKLQELVDMGCLPPKEKVGWRAAMGKEFPGPESWETVSFLEFQTRGLRLPAHPFLRGFLHNLQIELQHFNPNGLVQLASFVVVCEGFLSITPHTSLFRWIFEIRKQKLSSDDDEFTPLGDITIQMCLGYADKYLKIQANGSNRGWHASWF